MTMDHEISCHEAIKITTTNVDHFYKLLWEVLPGFRMSTKFHNILHYPSAIEYFHITLVNWSCLRFEASHMRIKKIMRNNSCHINIGLSIIKSIIIQNYFDLNISDDWKDGKHVDEKWSYKEIENELKQTYNDAEFIESFVISIET
uniref:Uncharacterized protein n=1 Tax=Strongyloides venezuelensis TaxID=75913 RepID=A0A0K0FJL6_STRVS